ncbi:MAG: imidazoleglycerol-phosphate dehydratase HisB [Treponema sp.]|jgi:imidazoleglycerol-phosphate dehydratase|nr:imidazoleglycerol-phosphate dehydratase HisB [Treponema sp.]
MRAETGFCRSAEIKRATKETDITVRLNLDGTGEARLEYPVGFMFHMLNTFARHGLFDLEIKAAGDLWVDQHHLVEDTGIVLGQCFNKALGDRSGIRRNGSCLFPMDETLARAAVDISGRGCLVFDAGLSNIPLVSLSPGSMTEQSSFQTDTVEDFWQGFVRTSAVTLHLDILRGRSDHHKIEALFKAAARALREACEIDARAAGIPSTKGVIV